MVDGHSPPQHMASGQSPITHLTLNSQEFHQESPCRSCTMICGVGGCQEEAENRAEGSVPICPLPTQLVLLLAMKAMAQEWEKKADGSGIDGYSSKLSMEQRGSGTRLTRIFPLLIFKLLFWKATIPILVRH